ncbi:unnamed protein product [Heligmosomoides polygyrus]|uniref:DDE Tnp4 domain-containing protein n=1 Tax=Heligmosomoides polygyrus TaxID=6339 RepID=A0A183GX43_HELPZ|nr:unnamed protein product [Heligmosomoides polygyrus]
MLIRAATPRHFRPRLSPLDVLDDHAFRQRFRISRRGFQFVLGIIEEDLSPKTMRSHSLSSAQKLRIFLETIGSSSLQRTTAITLGCSQSTVSRVVGEVSEVFWERRKEFITWPTDEERVAMSRRYSTKFVSRKSVFISALQILRSVWNHKYCSCYRRHTLKIIAPTEREDCCVNRSKVHMVERHLPRENARFKVFPSDGLYEDLQRGGKRDVLLGDSAYHLEQFLLKPYLGDGRTEALCFTEALQKGRVCVERAFCALKRQFLALHAELQYNPTTAGKIINAAMCLRNLCILTNEAAFDSVDESASDYGDAGDVQYNGSREEGTVRDYVVQRFFLSQPRL